MVGVLGMLRTVGARAGAKLAPGPVGQVLEPDEGANGVNERPFALDDVLASSEMVAADLGVRKAPEGSAPAAPIRLATLRPASRSLAPLRFARFKFASTSAALLRASREFMQSVY